MRKVVRVVVEINAPISEYDMVRLVRDNLPAGRNGTNWLTDKRGKLTHGPRNPAVKEYTRVVEAERRSRNEAMTVDLTGLPPKAAGAVRALVRALREAE